MPLLIPIGNDVIIHPIDPPSKIGTLYVPDTQRSKTRVNQGIVVAKGPACQDSDVEIADHVFFSGYTGDQVTLEEAGQFYVIPESMLIAKLVSSDVVLMNTETVKRIIKERFGEIRVMPRSYSSENEVEAMRKIFSEIETSLLNRIDSISIAEGFEFVWILISLISSHIIQSTVFEIWSKV